jgi:hypothetical protein
MTSNRSGRPIPDAENPEWTGEKFARAKRLNELPEALQQVLSSGKRGAAKVTHEDAHFAAPVGGCACRA